jgi:hypothetical protein
MDEIFCSENCLQKYEKCFASSLERRFLGLSDHEFDSAHALGWLGTGRNRLLE